MKKKKIYISKITLFNYRDAIYIVSTPFTYKPFCKLEELMSMFKGIKKEVPMGKSKMFEITLKPLGEPYEKCQNSKS